MEDLFGFMVEVGCDIATSNMGCGPKLLTFAITVLLFIGFVWYLHH